MTEQPKWVDLLSSEVADTTMGKLAQKRQSELIAEYYRKHGPPDLDGVRVQSQVQQQA